MRPEDCDVKPPRHALLHPWRDDNAAPPFYDLEDISPQAALTLWGRQLSQHFAHVALFRVNGLRASCMARYEAARLDSAAEPRCFISLLQANPLRWCLEAAAPVLGAGRAPGGSCVAQALGWATPRAFAVLPYLYAQQLVALAYVDHAAQALPLPRLTQVLHDLWPATDATVATKNLLRRAPKATHVAKPWRGRAPSAPRQPGRAPRRSAPQVLALPTPSTVAPLNQARALPQATPAARPRRTARRWLLAGLLLLGCWGFLQQTLSPPPAAMAQSGAVEIYIDAHQTLPNLAQRLAAAQLIRSPRFFVLLARLLREDRHLQAGYYTLKPAQWPWQILQTLQRGRVALLRLTFPEGLTLQQTAQLAENYGFCRATALLAAAQASDLLQRYKIDGNSLEGFLFPDTYEIARGSPPTVLLESMLQRFFHKLSSLPEASGLSSQALYDKVILASLVEREAFEPSEQARIAGVFVNRLEADMRLESCATVQYILGQPKAQLRHADLQLASPYNTYLHAGLPPGPIANPGLAALRAALRPEAHSWRYFVARQDGTHLHQFSKTFASHQAAQKMWAQKPNGSAPQPLDKPTASQL